MTWQFEGQALVETVVEKRIQHIRILPAHPDSPGKFAFLFDNGTGALITPSGAQAFAEGRSITVRTERVCLCHLPQIVSQTGSQAA